MTTHIEKTVFISYRRTNIPWALCIYQNLTSHGFDVFFDYQSIDSGGFEKIIVENIKARVHFVVILTPSALERCKNPNDWLRREIETAIDCQRNIVPLMLEGFDFSNPAVSKVLTGKLAQLKKYNGLRIYSEYFEEGMNRLISRFLNVTLDAVIQPVSQSVGQVTRKQQGEASKAKPVKQKELSAYEWFERGYQSSNFDEQIRFYTKAISLKANYAEAFVNRGFAFENELKFERAVKDYKEAVQIQPNNGFARASLAMVLEKLGRHSEATEQKRLARPLMRKETEYDQACFEAFCGNTKKALDLLRIALRKGQETKEWAQQDPDFESIHNDPRFKEIVSG